jgi:hypothetical protein
VDQVLFDMAAALADSAITAGALATIQFIEVAVDPDQEDVQVRQQPGQLITPRGELDHMLDDQIVAGLMLEHEHEQAVVAERFGGRDYCGAQQFDGLAEPPSVGETVRLVLALPVWPAG